ncbi:MAG TPA: 50S ribosomal protein L18 [Bacteroidetes bacterium]|nr:50S ribosomal protein L18 [Bacteroidota bacterium]
MKFSKEKRRQRIHYRVKSKIQGTAQRPRISVFRSNNEIYCQLVDDRKGHTLIAASSLDKGVCDKKATKVEQAKAVGKALAEKALAANITRVVFDRSGYLYHGRVKALADGAREGGLQF